MQSKPAPQTNHKSNFTYILLICMISLFSAFAIASPAFGLPPTKKTSTVSTAPTAGIPKIKLTNITVEDSIIPLPQGTRAVSGKTAPKTADHNPFLVGRGQSFSFTLTATYIDEAGNYLGPAAGITVTFDCSPDLQITGTNPATNQPNIGISDGNGNVVVYLKAVQASSAIYGSYVHAFGDFPSGYQDQNVTIVGTVIAATSVTVDNPATPSGEPITFTAQTTPTGFEGYISFYLVEVQGNQLSTVQSIQNLPTQTLDPKKTGPTDAARISNLFSDTKLKGLTIKSNQIRRVQIKALYHYKITVVKFTPQGGIIKNEEDKTLPWAPKTNTPKPAVFNIYPYEVSITAEPKLLYNETAGRQEALRPEMLIRGKVDKIGLAFSSSKKTQEGYFLHKSDPSDIGIGMTESTFKRFASGRIFLAQAITTFIESRFQLPLNLALDKGVVEEAIKRAIQKREFFEVVAVQDIKTINVLEYSATDSDIQGIKTFKDRLL